MRLWVVEDTPTVPKYTLAVAVDPVTSQHTAIYRDQAYWFCCSGCQSNFEKEPERYLRPIVA